MSVIGSNILAGAAGQGGGYTIERSLRLRSSASAYLSRTPASAGNRKTWTWSGWVKRGTLGVNQNLFSVRADATTRTVLRFAGDSIDWVDDDVNFRITTSAVYRDASAWYHIVVVIDTTQATSTNRLKLYVNGEQVTALSNTTYPSQNYEAVVNNTLLHAIGREGSSSSDYFDGYLTEVNFIDGQALTPSDFGNYNEDTGVWQPAKYIGSYGTNGFYLPFNDNTTTTTLAADASGNGNDWTPNNISLTSGATYDSMTDTPTPYADGGNYCTLNPLEKYSGLTIADGNLKVTSGDNTQYGAAGTLAISSGKWYYEAIFSNASLNNMAMGLTTTQNNVQTAQWAGSTGMFMCGNFVTGTAIHVGVNGSYTQVSTTLPAAGSYLVCAVDYDNGKAWFGTTTSSGGAVTWYPASTGGSVGDPVAGINPTITFSTTYPIRPFMGSYGAGLNWIANFGQRPFITTAPTGFLPLHTGNLPDSAIVDGSEYFNAVLYTGNAGNQSITGVGFQPDFVWGKIRSTSGYHRLHDVVRGSDNTLATNVTDAESTGNGIVSFDADGFTMDSGTNINQAYTYVAWNWKANGAGVSNTDGSITSTVSANPTSGFSIVTYTAPASGNFTVGHGLGVAPKMIITKRRDSLSQWWIWHIGLGDNTTDYLSLNTTNAETSSANMWGTVGRDSSVMGYNSGVSVVGGSTQVAYCFAEVEGYSKFGSYTGNGSTDGTFVYLGFRPKFIMIKGSSFVSNWFIEDGVRNGYNVNSGVALRPNLSNAEDGTTFYDIDILSNGFKLRTSTGDSNSNGATFIFAAFAESPFKNSLAR